MHRVQNTDIYRAALFTSRPEANGPDCDVSRVSSALKNVSNGAHTPFVMIPSRPASAQSTRTVDVAMGKSITLRVATPRFPLAISPTAPPWRC